ncbi:acetolactate synthase large subunit [Bradyrhizobium sp. USDA 3315]
MNGAESLVRTLVAGGVDTCFANPGTSEMHFVAALDRVEGMRCVLVLFEGIATGAAAGYARMAEKPAATLLHLGPGLANGLSNMHNALKASMPMINIVGDHATYHRKFDAPLTSDIETAAKPFSTWVRTSPDAMSVAADGADATAAALTPPGHVVTLILPADTAWDEAEGPAGPVAPPSRARVSKEVIKAAADVLRSGQRAMLLLGGIALRKESLELAGRIRAKTGARIMAEPFVARMDRGAGCVPMDRLPYPIDDARTALAGLDTLILVGSRAPVAFFAYPEKPSLLTGEDTNLLTLSRREDDSLEALERLAEELGAHDGQSGAATLEPPALATGILTGDAIAESLGCLLPENAIVIDEGVSMSSATFAATSLSQPHTWLQNLGGSIGNGMPMAIGAAIACPDRSVINLQADGSAMYMIQSLWTQAREELNITTVIFNNRAYASLFGELAKVGAVNPGRKALDMLELGRPDIDFSALAISVGVPAARVRTMEEFNEELARGLASPGPYLVEVLMS